MLQKFTLWAKTSKIAAVCPESALICNYGNPSHKPQGNFNDFIYDRGKGRFLFIY